MLSSVSEGVIAASSTYATAAATMTGARPVSAATPTPIIPAPTSHQNQRGMRPRSITEAWDLLEDKRW